MEVTNVDSYGRHLKTSAEYSLWGSMSRSPTSSCSYQTTGSFGCNPATEIEDPSSFPGAPAGLPVVTKTLTMGGTFVSDGVLPMTERAEIEVLVNYSCSPDCPDLNMNGITTFPCNTQFTAVMTAP